MTAIEKLRREKGMSRLGLAKAAGVSERTLDSWEKGISSGKIVLYSARIFAALGVSPQEYIAAAEEAEAEKQQLGR
jgi:transcriptional regulator with XRE-family HTH domain